MECSEGIWDGASEYPDHKDVKPSGCDKEVGGIVYDRPMGSDPQD